MSKKILRKVKHGMYHSSERGIWQQMIDRCRRPGHERFKDYGGRGIFVCDRWLESFLNFYSDMGQRPSPQHSVDRIDNDGPYSPENCRWATTVEQRRNNRYTRPLTIDGQTMLISDWAKLKGIDSGRIADRIREGWSVSDAVLTPVRSQNRRRCRFRSEQPEYFAWRNAIKRCTNRKDRKYKDYGGRGITVCQRWLESFESFLSDMGKRPSAEHSLDRKDVNGNYCPDNCRWATRAEQANNKRNSKTRVIICRPRRVNLQNLE